VTDTTQAAEAGPAVSETGPGGNGSTVRRASLSTMRLPELQAVAAELGISGTARMRKVDLLEAIRSRQAGGAPAEAPATQAPRRGTRRAGAPAGPPARGADQGSLPLTGDAAPAPVEAAPAKAPARAAAQTSAEPVAAPPAPAERPEAAAPAARAVAVEPVAPATPVVSAQVERVDSGDTAPAVADGEPRETFGRRRERRPRDGRAQDGQRGPATQPGVSDGELAPAAAAQNGHQTRRRPDGPGRAERSGRPHPAGPRPGPRSGP